MKAIELIPDTIEVGTKIRTGFYQGSGRHTKAVSMTDEVMALLEEQGWATINRNDAPRRGVTGQYVEVLGRMWSPEELTAEVAKAISRDEMYHGCGVYRLALKDGKVVASLYEGYHGSFRSAFCTREDWADECRRQMEALGDVVKADGSGCEFFIHDRYVENLPAGCKVERLEVPDVTGELHTIYRLAE